jgi:hypothetical protein
MACGLHQPFLSFAKTQKRVVLLFFDMSYFERVVRVNESNNIEERRHVRNKRLQTFNMISAVGISTWMCSQDAIVGCIEQERVKNKASADHGNTSWLP